jgi:hypothetical protein
MLEKVRRRLPTANLANLHSCAAELRQQPTLYNHTILSPSPKITELGRLTVQNHGFGARLVVSQGFTV